VGGGVLGVGLVGVVLGGVVAHGGASVGWGGLRSAAREAPKAVPPRAKVKVVEIKYINMYSRSFEMSL
jgi:hypothetical protein